MTARLYTLADYRSNQRGQEAPKPVKAIPFKPFGRGATDKRLLDAEADIDRAPLQLSIHTEILERGPEHYDTDATYRENRKCRRKQIAECHGMVAGARAYIIETPALGVRGAAVKLRLAMDTLDPASEAGRLLADAHAALLLANPAAFPQITQTRTRLAAGSPGPDSAA